MLLNRRSLLEELDNFVEYVGKVGNMFVYEDDDYTYIIEAIGDEDMKFIISDKTSDDITAEVIKYGILTVEDNEERLIIGQLHLIKEVEPEEYSREYEDTPAGMYR